MVVATKIEVQIRQHQFCRGQFRANATGIFGADFFVCDMATTRAYDLMGRRFGRLLIVERTMVIRLMLFAIIFYGIIQDMFAMSWMKKIFAN